MTSKKTTPNQFNLPISEEMVWDCLARYGWKGEKYTNSVDSESGETPLMRFLNNYSVFKYTALKYTEPTQFKLEKEHLLKILNKILEMGSGCSHLEIKDRCGCTALFYAEDEAVGLLLDAGANPNAVNDDGESVAMVAAYMHETKKLSLLLKVGCDLQFKNPKTGQSIFDCARPNCLEILKAEEQRVNLDLTLNPSLKNLKSTPRL